MAIHPQNSLQWDAVVIGAGISGLVCAWGMQKRGRRVLVLEAAARAGGCIGTTHEQGFLLEAGPNSALDTTPLIGELLADAGIADQRIGANPASRNRYILREGRLIALPLSPPQFLTSPLFSAPAKLRLLREPFIHAGEAARDESIAAFVHRRLGKEFLDYAINPFVAGVYAGDPDKLSVRAAFPRLFDLEQKYGSLIRGAIAGARERKRNPEKSKQSAQMFSFANGMQTLTDALAARLDCVELNAEAVALERQAGELSVTALKNGEELRYRCRAAIVATPAYAAAELAGRISPAAREALAAITYPPVAVVITAYARSEVTHALDGFGALLPQREGRQTLGTIFSSTLFTNRAPADKVLLTTFVGGMRQPALVQLDESVLAQVVQAENARLFGTPATAQFARVRRWQRAIPQYTFGHLERIAAIEDAEHENPGLFFCANYRGGIAVGDCVKSASQMSARVDAYLGR